jgi:purine-nucleoside phosphorylase
MAGRFHRYEGWSNDQATFPVQVMRSLGADYLIVSNAAGGVSPKLAVGDIVILRDHLNLMGGTFQFNGDRSETGHPERLGGPNRGSLYDPLLANAARTAAIQAGFTANFGTYLATLGPTYETRAEYRMMRRIGADVVGMSTVPEVLVANRLNMKVLGLSMVSNVADPDRPVIANHEEVLLAGKAAGAKMEAIVGGVLSRL